MNPDYLGILAEVLRALEVEYKSATVVIKDDRANIVIDGEYFGIYDFKRKTFVD